MMLSLLIIAHEFGHMIAALAFKVRVETFGIGVGPKIWEQEIAGIRWRLSWLPFGGYVKFGTPETEELDDEEEDDEDEEENSATGQAMSFVNEFVDDTRWYANQSPLRRLLIVAAGPIFSFLLGVVFLFFAFRYEGSLVPTTPLTVLSVGEEAGAEKAGVLPGDVIESVNGTFFNSSYEGMELIRNSEDNRVSLGIKRGEESLLLDVSGLIIGGSLHLGIEVVGEPGEISTFDAAGTSLLVASDLFLLHFQFFTSLLKQDGEFSISQIGGPVRIVTDGTKAFQDGFFKFFLMFGAVSISLSFMNLLPLPVLDGGQLILIGIAAVRGRELSHTANGLISLAGAVLLLAVTITILVKDIVVAFF